MGRQENRYKQISSRYSLQKQYQFLIPKTPPSSPTPSKSPSPPLSSPTTAPRTLPTLSTNPQISPTFIIISQVQKMSSFQDFIDKLNPYPNDVNRLCRLIRHLDKRVQSLQTGLTIQQKKFQVKIKELKDKKVVDMPVELKAQYDAILLKQKELYGYSREKEAIADQLLDIVENSYEMVKTDLKNKIKDKPTEELQKSLPKKKKQTVQNIIKLMPKQQQFLYDNVNPKYCYCNVGGFGEMVGCENNYCEKEWFHSQCIQDKSYINEENWHCKDCKKLVDKFKKSSGIREFVI